MVKFCSSLLSHAVASSPAAISLPYLSNYHFVIKLNSINLINPTNHISKLVKIIHDFPSVFYEIHDLKNHLIENVLMTSRGRWRHEAYDVMRPMTSRGRWRHEANFIVYLIIELKLINFLRNNGYERKEKKVRKDE